MVDVDVAGELRGMLLVHRYYGVEEFGDSLAVAADCRADRHAEQVSQLLDVDAVATGLKLVVHVQGHHHRQVHVDELGGKVEVALDVGGVHHVQHHVRGLLQKILADVEFFRAVGREGICAGKVDQGDLVTLVFELSFLGVDSDSAVVSYVLVGTGGYVEKGCLSAIGVAHEGNANAVAAFFGKFGNLPVQNGRERLSGMFCRDMLFGLFFADYLYLGGFFAAERYFISEDFVFDRVLEGGVENHPYGFSADETHLYQALAETPVARYFCYYGLFAGFEF